jgi:hypothetical protein
LVFLGLSGPPPFCPIDQNSRLSGHDVLEDLVNVGLGEILSPAGPQKRNNNVAFNVASDGDD